MSEIPEKFTLHTTKIYGEPVDYFFVTGSRGRGVSVNELCTLMNHGRYVLSINEARAKAAEILKIATAQITPADYLNHPPEPSPVVEKPKKKKTIPIAEATDYYSVEDNGGYFHKYYD